MSGWAALLPRTEEEAAAFRAALQILCEHFGLSAFRVAADCTACGGALPDRLEKQGIGQAEIYPGKTVGFMLCESCGHDSTTKGVRHAVVTQLQLEYEQATTTAGRGAEA